MAMNRPKGKLLTRTEWLSRYERLKALDPRFSGGLQGVGRVMRIGDAGPPWGLLVPTYCVSNYTSLDVVSQ